MTISLSLTPCLKLLRRLKFTTGLIRTTTCSPSSWAKCLLSEVLAYGDLRPTSCLITTSYHRCRSASLPGSPPEELLDLTTNWEWLKFAIKRFVISYQTQNKLISAQIVKDLQQELQALAKRQLAEDEEVQTRINSIKWELNKIEEEVMNKVPTMVRAPEVLPLRQKSIRQEALWENKWITKSDGPLQKRLGRKKALGSLIISAILQRAAYSTIICGSSRKVQFKCTFLDM